MLLVLPLLVGAGPVRVTLHVATIDGKPVAGEPWLTTQLARANDILAVTDVQVEEGRRTRLDDSEADIMTVAERHALGSRAERDGTVHVFVVRKLADKDKDGAFINGVHWRYRGASRRYRGRRYIILAASAHADTLAHELGHFFGLPHVKAPDNLMSYQRAGADIFLNRMQIRRVNRRLRLAVRTRLVIPRPAPSPAGDAAE
jgi:hypothetical protein